MAESPSASIRLKRLMGAVTLLLSAIVRRCE